MGRGAWQVTVLGAIKNQTQLSILHVYMSTYTCVHMCTHTHIYLSVKQFKYYTKIIRVLSAIYLPNCYGKQLPSFHHVLSITSSLQAVFFTK